MRAPIWVPFSFLFAALAGLLLFRFAPIGIALVGSLYKQGIRGDEFFVAAENYAELFADPAFWHSLRITLLFNLIINPFQIFCALCLAMLVLRPGPFVGFFRSSFLAPMTVSIAMTAVIWSILLDPNLGPVNGFLKAVGLQPQPFFRSSDQALLSIVGIATWKGAGYWMIFLLAGLIAIPKDVLDAADLDGASKWRRFWHVILPLMKRPLAFVLVADTAINFLMFAPVYVITQGGPSGATQLLMFETYQAAFAYLDHGRSLALSVVILALIMTIVALEMRILRQKDT